MGQLGYRLLASKSTSIPPSKPFHFPHKVLFSPESFSETLFARVCAWRRVCVDGSEANVAGDRLLCRFGRLRCHSHPGVVANLLQSGPIWGPQGQAPFDQLLTLWRRHKAHWGWEFMHAKWLHLNTAQKNQNFSFKYTQKTCLKAISGHLAGGFWYYTIYCS